MTISNEKAAEIVAKLRKDVESLDEITGGQPADPCALLLIKLYDDLEALKKGTAFLGVGGGIPPVQRVG